MAYPQRVFFPRPPNNTLLFGNYTTEYSKLEQGVLDKYALEFTNLELELYSVVNFLGLIQLVKWMDNVDLILVETPAFKTKDADPDNNYKIIKDNVGPIIYDNLVPNYEKSMEIHTGCNHIIKDYHDDCAKRIYNKIWKKN